jgi:NitT/TauT family transport system ATP-binding protein
MEVHVALRNINKAYRARGTDVVALSNISFEIARNEFVSFVGPSGCGKSTILKILAGLTAPSGGQLDRNSFNGSEWNDASIGFVFQSPVLLPWKTILSNVLFPSVVEGRERSKSVEQARQLLALVGLAGFEASYPNELSGGMQQRAAICRALMCSGDVLLMDEPFGALDAITRDTLMVELKQICDAEKRTVIFVTHSISEAVFLSDRVIVMSPRPGRITAVVDSKFNHQKDISILETLPFQRMVSAIRKQIQQDITQCIPSDTVGSVLLN